MIESSRTYLAALAQRTPKNDFEREAFLQGDPGSPGEVWSMRLQAKRAYDKKANLLEELQLRLVGEGQRGEAGESELSLIAPLNRALSSVGAGGNVNMVLAGVSAGSTVLHLRPEHRYSQSVGDIPLDSTPADDACRQLLRVLNSFERQEHSESVKGVAEIAHFVHDLDTLNLDATFAWTGPSGTFSMSEITYRGRGYVDRMLQSKPDEKLRAISGRVTELKLSGYMKVKSGTPHRSPAYSVYFESEQLKHMPRVIGETVHLIVRVKSEVTGFGTVASEKYFFEDFNGVESRLFGAPGE